MERWKERTAPTLYDSHSKEKEREGKERPGRLHLILFPKSASLSMGH